MTTTLRAARLRAALDDVIRGVRDVIVARRRRSFAVVGNAAAAETRVAIARRAT